MRIGPFTVSLAVSVLLGACTGMNRDGSTEQASGLTAVQFADIPVPDGMKLQTGLNESHSYESGQFRFADLFYFGNLPTAEVTDYMKRRMALHGWQLIDEKTGERSELVFVRRPNRVRCEVWVDNSSVTRMHVEVRTPGSD